VTQTTETFPTSGTRVLDVAHQIVAELGTWQYHPALTVTVYTHMVNGPQVRISLMHHETDDATRAVFLDAATPVLDVDAMITASHDGGLLSVLYVQDFRGTGVAVHMSGRIHAEAAARTWTRTPAEQAFTAASDKWTPGATS
jgi:hypothetical protein